MIIQEKWKRDALVDEKQYLSMYKNSIANNEEFWNTHGKRIDWIKKYSKIKDVRYSKEEVKIKWFYDGTLNVTQSCIDRHVKNDPNKIVLGSTEYFCLLISFKFV